MTTPRPYQPRLDSARRWVPRRPIRCRLADTPELRHEAMELVLQRYKQLGYLPPDATKSHVHSYVGLPGAEIFVACDPEPTVVATATYVPDGPWRLPMEKLYAEELQALRRRGRMLAEIIGFASVARERDATVPLILSLTRAIVWYALKHGMDDLLVVVNPRHQRFYSRFLPFELLGPERRYPVVQNAPAVALRLDLHSLSHHRTTKPVLYQRYIEVPSPRSLLAPLLGAPEPDASSPSPRTKPPSRLAPGSERW
jgi:hypothetical protein